MKSSPAHGESREAHRRGISQWGAGWVGDSPPARETKSKLRVRPPSTPKPAASQDQPEKLRTHTGLHKDTGTSLTLPETHDHEDSLCSDRGAAATQEPHHRGCRAPEHTHGPRVRSPQGQGAGAHARGPECAPTRDRAVRSYLLPSLTGSFSLESRGEPRSPATRTRTSHCCSAHAHLPTPGLCQGQGHVYSRICVFLNCLLCVKSYNFHLVPFFTNIM